MSNSPNQWQEEDKLNLLTALLEIADEPAESYDPSINLFDRIAKVMKKSISYEEIMDTVRDLQQRYYNHEEDKNDKIFIISHKIWGRRVESSKIDEKGKSKSGSEGRKCLHCLTGDTPQWRMGPMGPSTLCNACGVRYNKSGLLLPEYRPVSSPTFVGSDHSNSHKKVLEMRWKKKQKTK